MKYSLSVLCQDGCVLKSIMKHVVRQFISFLDAMTFLSVSFDVCPRCPQGFPGPDANRSSTSRLYAVKRKITSLRLQRFCFSLYYLYLFILIISQKKFCVVSAALSLLRFFYSVLHTSPKRKYADRKNNQDNQKRTFGYYIVVH